MFISSCLSAQLPLIQQVVRKMGEWLFNGYRVSPWDNENFLEMDSGDGCTILWMYLMPVNYTIKMVKMVSFVMFILHNKKSPPPKKRFKLGNLENRKKKKLGMNNCHLFLKVLQQFPIFSWPNPNQALHGLGPAWLLLRLSFLNPRLHPGQTACVSPIMHLCFACMGSDLWDALLIPHLLAGKHYAS